MNSKESVKVKMRDSNMELLRIVAMSMILVGHFFFHGLNGILKGTLPHFISLPFTICGVNLFFMISGWFGVRFTLKSVTRIVVTTIFFLWINYFALMLLGADCNSKIIFMLLTPVEASGLWFIMAYLGILIASPLLNAGLRNMSRRELNIFIIAFSIFCIYCGWFGGNYANMNGHNIVQGFWLYCLGYWLRGNRELTDRVSNTWLLAVSVLVAAIFIWLQTFEALPDIKRYTYNDPSVVVLSLTIFIYFTRLKIKSRAINYVAGASLGCYMLQDGIFGDNYLYKWIKETYLYIIKHFDKIEAVIYILLLLTGIFVAIWVVSILLTPVANRLSTITTNFLQKIWKGKA